MKLRFPKSLTLNNLVEPIAFVFFLAFVLPFTVYFFNLNEFEFGSYTILKDSLFISPVLLIPLLILLSLGRRISEIVKRFCTVSSVFLLIATFFLPIQNLLMDGGGPAKEFLLGINVEYIKFIGLLSAIIAAYYFKKSLLRDIVIFSSLASVIWILYIIVSTHFADGSRGIEPAQNQPSEHFAPYESLSKDENIFIFSFDGLQGDYVTEVLDESPELASQFDGFTFYPHTASVAPCTTLTTSIMFLGYVPLSQHTTQIVTEELIPDSLFKDYVDAGYAVSLQDPAKYGAKVQGACSRKIMDMADATLAVANLRQAALSRIMPSILENYALKFLNFLHFQQETQPLKALLLKDTKSPFTIEKSDFNFIGHFCDNINTNNKNKVVQFYHFLFSHEPNNFDRSCRYHLTAEQPQNYDSHKDQIYCALVQMGRLIKALKENGVYDNSIIIFASDHGAEFSIKPGTIQIGNESFCYGERFGRSQPPSRYNAFLMFKDKRSRGNMIASDRKISLLDIMPTICESSFSSGVCKGKNFEGHSLRSLPEGDYARYLMISRPLKVTAKTAFEHSQYDKYEIHGDVRLEAARIFKETLEKQKNK